jgi:hypothetical protein
MANGGKKGIDDDIQREGLMPKKRSEEEGSYPDQSPKESENVD